MPIAAGETTFEADPHTYATTGSYPISVTITGLDGILNGSTTASGSGAYMDDNGDVYVLGADNTNNTATLSQDATTGDLTVTLNGGTPAVFSGAASVVVRMPSGTDTISAAGINLPLTVYGGTGSDTITGGDGGNLIYGGSAGGNTIHAGAGDDTIYSAGNTANTITGASGNLTVYSGAGHDQITGGTGNNEIYGGAGGDNITCFGQNNWIQGGSGTDFIQAESGKDWIEGGSGGLFLTESGGNAVVHGGSGENYLAVGGTLDDVYGGSGPNYIYDEGTNDVIQGGTGPNYIYPNYDGADSLASIAVKDSNNNPTFDGTIDDNGNPYTGDDQEDPGYGGTWTFDELDSGARLVASAADTPLAVYATWNTSQLTPPAGKNWATDAVYKVYEVVNGVPVNPPLGTVPIDQKHDLPGHDSPITNDRPWTRLGVWNVPVGDTLEVTLSAASGDEICVGDVMIHAIWPTVSIAAANVTPNPKVVAANWGDYTDWRDACQGITVSVDGQGNRVPLQLSASIEPLYTLIHNASMNDWTAKLPSVSGLMFWNSQRDGTQLTAVDASDDLLNSPLTSYGTYDQTVWASADPNSSSTVDITNITFVLDPEGAKVAASVPANVAHVRTQTEFFGEELHVLCDGGISSYAAK